MADELSERAQRLKADFEKAAALAKERQERETKAKEQPLRRHEPTARPVLAPKGPMAREVDRTAWQEQQSKVDRAVKEQAIEPVRLTVSDFALVHSLVGRSRYIELARWPLRWPMPDWRRSGCTGPAPSSTMPPRWSSCARWPSVST